MADKTVSRKFELFAIHAHQGSDVDYDELMRIVFRTRPEERVLLSSEDALAISKVQEVDGLYMLTIVEGPLGVNPLIYDLASANERTEELEQNEVLAMRTHALIDPKRRRVAIEYVRRGAKYTHIASVIEHVIRTKSPNLHNFSLDFSPIVKTDFLKELDGFQRVRSARITVNKPNASWSDHYTDISSLMDASNGDKASLEVNAPREQTLSKVKGILKIIKDVVKDPQPYLQDVFLNGTRKGEDAETRLSLKNHVTHSRAKISVDDTGHVNEHQAFHHLKGLIDK